MSIFASYSAAIFVSVRIVEAFVKLLFVSDALENRISVIVTLKAEAFIVTAENPSICVFSFRFSFFNYLKHFLEFTVIYYGYYRVYTPTFAYVVTSVLPLPTRLVCHLCLPLRTSSLEASLADALAFSALDQDLSNGAWRCSVVVHYSISVIFFCGLRARKTVYRRFRLLHAL